MIVKSPVNGIEIDVDSLVNAVRSLAEKSPDNIYMPAVRGEKCKYSSGQCKDGSCGCIVGQGLAAIGLNPADFEDDNGRPPSAAKIVGDCSNVWSKPASWLRRVQYYQDQGKTWSRAIILADKQTASQ